ncbi:TlpA disulfide reductase family protein [Pedobacter ginsenosidimutans]|nr:TlpA disulfide reductase family protein [Pedobacter ginsenosidimutans]
MKICFALIFAMLSLKGFAQNNASRFNLSGKTDLKDGEKIILEYRGNKDSAFVKDGSFKFSGYLSEPSLASFKHGKTNIMEGPQSVRLFLEPGNLKLNILSGKFFKAELLGSLTQTDWDKIRLKKAYDEVLDKIDDLNKAIKERGSFDSLKANLSLNYAERSRLFKVAEKNSLAFIRNNPNSYLSPYLLSSLSRSLPKDSVQFYYRSFSGPVLNSAWGRFIYKELDHEETSKIGQPAPGFSAKLANGKMISLAEFKSKKYVLLDFWGTWCVHCRALSPDLIEMYKKYKSKGLEIVSIATDHDRKLWQKAIVDDRTGLWKHILLMDASKSTKGDDLVIQYNIPAYPTFILIDKEGKIAGRYDGEGNDFHINLKNKLAKIFE